MNTLFAILWVEVDGNTRHIWMKGDQAVLSPESVYP